jgi:hypothetical protein
MTKHYTFSQIKIRMGNIRLRRIKVAHPYTELDTFISLTPFSPT